MPCVSATEGIESTAFQGHSSPSTQKCGTVLQDPSCERGKLSSPWGWVLWQPGLISAG